VALVMFDYDGVIVDSLNVFTLRFSQACRENGFNQIKASDDVISLFDSNVYETMRQRGLDGLTIDAILERYEVLQGVHLGNLKLFEGIREALDKVSKKHSIYVITSNLSNATIQVLEQNEIKSFKGVIGADIEKSKIRKILSVKSLHPETTAFYVGDTKGDMIEGRQAGCLTIGVTWGWHTPEKIQEGFPDYLVKTPEALAELLSE
jgi:phosphoglycolate phosphatase